jgi:hypothetical protein
VLFRPRKVAQSVVRAPFGPADYHPTMNVVQKLRQLVGEIRTSPSPSKRAEAWALAERLLMRMPVQPSAIEAACAAKDADALDAIVARLEHPGPAAAPDHGIPDEELDKALKAFKKRLKVMRLADESKLRGRRLSSGKESEIDAIVPPTEFPREVWAALAARGDLRDTGGGFYRLPQ